jgi:hypothetical protein
MAVKESSTRLKRDFGRIKRAPSHARKKHQELQYQLKSAKKSFKTEMDNAYRRDYFYRVHNEMMKRQLQRHLDIVGDEDPKESEPVVQHQLEERIRVQQVLCDLSKDLNPEDIVARKVLAINYMVALASRQELQTHKPKSTPAYQDVVKKESPVSDPDPSPQLDEFPLILGKTQCIFCIGNERYSYDQRTRTFERASHMWAHIENVHLKHLEQLIPCGHPVCKTQKLVLTSVMHFKNHVAKVHRVNLWP